LECVCPDDAHPEPALLRDTPLPATFPNLIYIKVPKTASSTTGGIARRLAIKHGLSGVGDMEWISQEPGVWANHKTRAKLDDKIRKLKLPAFTFTCLRDPVDRCLSEFYMKVSRGHCQSPLCHDEFANTTPDKMRWMQDRCRDFQLAYIAPPDLVSEAVAAAPAYSSTDERRRAAKLVVSRGYNFIGVDELYDESAVILASQLGANLTDVLYLPAKVSGAAAAEDPMTGRPLIQHPPLDEEPQEVREYAASDEFKQANVGDYALLEFATAAIHRRLEADARLRAQLEHFSRLRDAAERDCGAQAADEGYTPYEQSENCYWSDNGCGYRCLDEFVESFHRI